MYYSIYKLMERAGLKDTVETIFIAFFFNFPIPLTSWKHITFILKILSFVVSLNLLFP